ncbi:hypothetical protein N7463_010342 [Penicillium fimorum]|uniref:Mitochondrial division protein 1 n=1 Tax=Penicillium fimorum TaxID=1882269 RepID=A0A9W9XKL9_9EURO|nr:hypothetical protein N7463_010342 [Penicillium fimorum]
MTDRINQNMDLGKLEGVMEAGFESFSNRNEDQCLLGTRTEILRDIIEWAMSPSQKSIFWLNGMAGTGKSTISRTVAGLLKDRNHLGANFFFKRGEGDRGNAKKFFPTLVKQLMLRISELRSGVQKALDHDPDIISKSPREQFEKLLLQPLLDLNQLGQQPQIVVIVIDALDECEHEQDIRNIIRLLPRLQMVKAVRLRIFLTSRPELPISLEFSEIGNREYQDLVLHEIPEEVTADDIYLFLQNRFAKIQHDRNISPDWPSDDVVQEIVTMSVPLFISAATVCRYIEHSKLEPTERLAELLKDSRRYAKKMDKTYRPILTRLLDDEESDESEQQLLLHQFQKIVGAIILLAVPLSTNALSLFLGIEVNQISNLLDSFRSVLSVPSDRDLPIRILHLSFRDFLVQTESDFLIDEPNKHKEIALLCIEKMRRLLRKDICNLEGFATRRADIDPQSLRRDHHSVLSEFLYDAKRFTLKNSQIADDAPLQLYCSGLIFAPKKAIESWNSEMQTLEGHSDWVRSVAFSSDGALLASASSDETVRLWDPATGELKQTLEGHSDSIWSVAFSPDGALLASASSDKTVRLWDPATGALMQTLGVNELVTDLKFGHDASYLITNLGSLDVQSESENYATSSNNVNPGIFIKQQWIKLNGKNVLWLPPGSRSNCFAINGNLLALGHASGLISFIGFQV